MMKINNIFNFVNDMFDNNNNFQNGLFQGKLFKKRRNKTIK